MACKRSGVRIPIAPPQVRSIIRNSEPTVPGARTAAKYSSSRSEKHRTPIRTWCPCRCRGAASEPVKLNETSGGWVCLWRLLGLDGCAGLVDPDLGGQPGCLRALALEANRAGGVGLVEDVLAAGLDGPGGAVVHGGRCVQADA